MKPSRVVIVTGAASGIGRATAELFAERGFGVVAVDRDDVALAWCCGSELLSRGPGENRVDPGSIDVSADGMAVSAGEIVALAGDVAAESTSVAMVSLAMERWGRLDVAVLNAGIAGGLGFEADGAIERFDQMMAINTRAVALGIRHSAPAMRRSGGGAIVATASTSGIGGDPRNWAYNSSKAAVINMVRAAAIDYATQGIRVNAVAPGPVETAISRRLTDDPDARQAMARRVPMQRWGRPRELAEVIWFLASPAASFVTGVTIPVDGGLSSNIGHFDPPAVAT